MVIWSLTTDDDYGIDTALYLTERAAYEALALHWFTHETDGKRQEHPDVQRKADYLAALDKGEDEAERWLGNYIIDEGEHRSLRYRVTKHDHPWTFPDTSSDPIERMYDEAFAEPDTHTGETNEEKETRIAEAFGIRTPAESREWLALSDAAMTPMHHAAFADAAEPAAFGPAEREYLIYSALDGFWQVIARAHPECKTGDLSPDATLTLRASAVRAYREWAEWNGAAIDEPAAEDDDDSEDA